jgi:hypothetical protein
MRRARLARCSPLFLWGGALFFAMTLWGSLHERPWGEIGRTIAQFATGSHQRLLERQVAGLLAEQKPAPRIHRAPENVARGALPLPVRGSARILVAVGVPLAGGLQEIALPFGFRLPQEDLPSGLGKQPQLPPPKRLA